MRYENGMARMELRTAWNRNQDHNELEGMEATITLESLFSCVDFYVHTHVYTYAHI